MKSTERLVSIIGLIYYIYGNLGERLVHDRVPQLDVAMTDGGSDEAP